MGTSGWSYDWNPDGLEWYVSSSGLNAVELNASFYRFPRASTVRRWSRVGEGIRWAVKVHRGVTHTRRLSRSSLDLWERFRDLFSPMDRLIDFYLFQMPPGFSRTPENEERVEEYMGKMLTLISSIESGNLNESALLISELAVLKDIIIDLSTRIT